MSEQHTPLTQREETMLAALKDALIYLNATAPVMERQGSHGYRHCANLVAAAIAKASPPPSPLDSHQEQK